MMDIVLVTDPRTASIPVSDRVLAVLDLFMGPIPEWTVEDAAAAMAIPASTIYRYFRSLATHGLIHDHLPGRYVLGGAVMALDRQMRLHDPLIEIVAPAMQRLVGAMEQPCVALLARLYKDTVMCVDQVRHREPAFSISYERGRMMPLDRGATSKVILAHLPVSVMRRLARSQPQLLAHNADIRRDTRRIRADGVCIAMGEVDAGRLGIAVPIVLPHRKQVASLSVVLERERGDVDDIVSRLRTERQAIETALSAMVTTMTAPDRTILSE